jgi:hypothetical protein
LVGFERFSRFIRCSELESTGGRARERAGGGSVGGSGTEASDTGLTVRHRSSEM